jgi:hypothetical protein
MGGIPDDTVADSTDLTLAHVVRGIIDLAGPKFDADGRCLGHVEDRLG